MDEQLNILIIDDNPDDRDAYIRLLKKAQGMECHCHEVTEGSRGMEAVGTLRPDCVLLDYSLPGANGLDVLKGIKLVHPEVPVIMLTGQGNEAIAVQAIKQGADDYLSKSALSVETLQRSIRMAIEHSHLQNTIDAQGKLLQKNETRYQQLIDGVRDYAFCWLDINGRVESWNSGAEKMKLYTADEIIGQHFSVFYPEETRHDGAPQKALDCALREGQCIEEGWRVRKDGSKFWASVQLDALRDAAGNHIGFVKVTRDMTERKQAEMQRQHLMDRLMQSNTELERFAYVASHDMQEPIRMVINFSKIVVKDYSDRLDDEAREYMKFVTDSAERIHDMIDDLLDYARMGSEEHNIATVDGTSELGHVLVNLGELIRETGAQVTYDRLPQFEGNPVQFMRLMQNLIANAIKYQPPGNVPKIHIGAEDMEMQWRIAVKDNGIGIDEAFTRQIFEPFRRLHSWDEVRGTGIGLAVCKKIAENLGGDIWVESVPRQGSTFFIAIPKSPARQQAA